MTSPYAIQIDQTGAPDVMKQVALTPRPPKDGEALVRQTAVGLNFVDTYFRSGLYPAKLPFTPGSEGAGIVEAVGDGVVNVSVGDRVAYLGSGTYATHYTGNAATMMRLPDAISEEDAAAVMLKGLTAWMLLFEIRPIQRGEDVLIWAPVGGVGSILTPWASHLGARVIAVTSSEKKAALAKAAGAHDVVIGYEDVAMRVWGLTEGKGVDVALDSVGKLSADASLSSLKPRGWFISYGNASGAVDPVPPGRLAQGGSLIMTRPTLHHFIADPAAMKRGAEFLFSAMENGVFRPSVGQYFPLAEISEAHAALESGKTTGATILTP